MHRNPVFSSRISSVGWENEILEIEFKNGAVYQYYDVSEQEYLNFINSNSLGHALSILDKKHPYHKV